MVPGVCWTLLLLAPALASKPARVPRAKPPVVVWQEGLSREVVHVKVVAGSPRVPAPAGARVAPLFSRDPATLRADRRTFDPEQRLADLTRWYRVVAPPGQGAAVATALNAEPWVEWADLALLPAPPPGDLDPVTPDLTGHQDYRGAAPDGFGFHDLGLWPAADGRHVTVADLEYSWLSTHEDLEATADAQVWGYDVALYQSHGVAVLGQLVAGDNGYGVTGLVPAATPVVVHPFVDATTYSVADAVDAAVSLLEAGDVLLIEQQAYDPRVGSYLPVEWDPTVFDAISLAVAKGIVVVEPAANGAQDLAAAELGDWFDRSVRDSGAILVGGGASPRSGLTPRTWVQWGSSYGPRVDVQGWYDSIATAWTDDTSTVTADLFLPASGDARQGYTSQFGGTSGASPMVAGICAAANSVALDLHGQPFDPLDLRALLVATGTPQPESDAAQHWIGPQPDLQGVLRAGLLP